MLKIVAGVDFKDVKFEIKLEETTINKDDK